jgi:hypothetical protein
MELVLPSALSAMFMLSRISRGVTASITAVMEIHPFRDSVLVGRRVSFCAMPFCCSVAVAVSKWFIET